MSLDSNSTENKLLEEKAPKKSCASFYTIGIAGNPNVGKSTVFNGLTGMNQHTGNWTGKTVANTVGKCVHKDKEFLFTDIPGTYSFISCSEEEEIAKNYICFESPSAVVVVVDATCLERNLNLVFQTMEFTKNIIVCVNLLDEAKKKGISIDLIKLSEKLGVPVVGTIARNPRTLTKLLDVIYDVSIKKTIPNPIKAKYSENPEQYVENIYAKAEEICNSVCSYKITEYNKHDRKIDKILTSKIFGIPIMLCFLGIIFWLTITGANYPSKILSNLFSIIQNKLYVFFDYINAPNWVTGILVDGAYQTLSWVISVMLPPMAIFFPLFTFLEDLGYLPRIAFNLDKCFKKCCASGKQSLTMCMGFGCNAVGIIGCRIINSPREKILAILTNVFVPCNGRFPLLIAVSSVFVGEIGIKFGASIISTIIVLFIIILGVFTTFVISKILSKTILKGTPSTFTLELPPYRKPLLGKIIIRSIFDRTLFVLGRAVSVAIPAGIVIWILGNIGINEVTLLDHIVMFLNPFAKLMGLDGYILTAFILGIPANEIVLPIILMCYLRANNLIDLENNSILRDILVQNGWTIITAINVMIFTLMHFPCATTLLTIKNETKSLKWTILSFMIPTLCGIILCISTNGIYAILS